MVWLSRAVGIPTGHLWISFRVLSASLFLKQIFMKGFNIQQIQYLSLCIWNDFLFFREYCLLLPTKLKQKIHNLDSIKTFLIYFPQKICIKRHSFHLISNFFCLQVLTIFWLDEADFICKLGSLVLTAHKLLLIRWWRFYWLTF